jgi:predicted CoA-binding protein
MNNINRQSVIREFLAQKTAAVVGVSRTGKEFSNHVFAALQHAGIRTYPVNPHAQMIGGEFCFPDLAELPERPDFVVIMVPSDRTMGVVESAVRTGIRRVWIHQGASTPKAAEFCRKAGVSVVDGECVLMHLPPVKGGHKFHRWVRGVVGQMPQ